MTLVSLCAQTITPVFEGGETYIYVMPYFGPTTRQHCFVFFHPIYYPCIALTLLPSSSSDPGSHSGPFSPLPTTVRAFIFIATASGYKPITNCDILGRTYLYVKYCARKYQWEIYTSGTQQPAEKAWKTTQQPAEKTCYRHTRYDVP